MDRQLSHLVRLVDDLLEVSRITRGQVELRREQVRLDAAIHSAIETSEPLIRAGNHRLIVSLPDEPLMLDADPVRLAQIFGNLLNNAAKYSEKGGQIEIAARREGDDALVTIRDSGDGIAPEQLTKLFQIFTRGERSCAAQPERAGHRSGAGAPADRNARRPRRGGERRARQGQLLQRAPAAERRGNVAVARKARGRDAFEHRER